MEQTQVMLPFVGASKKELAQRAQSVLAEAMENGNVLEVAEAIAGLENLVKEAKALPEWKQFQDAVREQAGKVYTSQSGAKIEPCETGTKYHYEKTGDRELAALYCQQDELKAKIAAREKFLQSIPKEGIEVANTEVGEVWTIYPPYKTSTSSFKITLAK